MVVVQDCGNSVSFVGTGTLSRGAAPFRRHAELLLTVIFVAAATCCVYSLVLPPKMKCKDWIMKAVSRRVSSGRYLRAEHPVCGRYF